MCLPSFPSHIWFPIPEVSTQWRVNPEIGFKLNVLLAIKTTCEADLHVDLEAILQVAGFHPATLSVNNKWSVFQSSDIKEATKALNRDHLRR